MTKGFFRVFEDLEPRKNKQFSSFAFFKDHLEFIQRLSLEKTLTEHRGCVNSISWNWNGTLLLSGADDHRLIVTKYPDYKVLVDYRTTHRANIFSAKFLSLSDDRKIVSCGGNGTILYTDLDDLEATSQCSFDCHMGTAYSVASVPDDPHTFLSCGEDGTVRWFDLRMKTSCCKTDCNEDILIQTSHAVTSMTINPLRPHQLAIGCSDSCARIFDRRALGTRALGSYNPNSQSQLISCLVAPDVESRQHRITALEFHPSGEEILVSYSSEYIYIFPVEECRISEEELNLEDRKLFLSLTEDSRRKSRIPAPIKRLRLRGDWSDTGPNSRPESEVTSSAIGQARPALHANLMQRMTSVLSRLLNDPVTRRAIHHASLGGESSAPISQGATPTSPTLPLPQEVSQEEAPSPSTSRGAVSEPITITRTRQMSIDPSGTPGTPPMIGHSDFAPPIDCVSYASLAGQEEEPPIEDREISQNIESQPEMTPAETIRRSINSIRENLASRRDVFYSRHNSEPSVTVSFSAQGTSSALISLNPSSSGQFGSGGEAERVSANNISKSYACKVCKPVPTMKLIGHRNARTAIKEACFWGKNFVISGSDCGRVFMWDKRNGDLVKTFEADRHVVNCVQPHPFDPILATSGIDHDVKIWSPLSPEPTFDKEEAKQIMERNAAMLEETRDTVTVPASFMIRMLASLQSIRWGDRLYSESTDEEGTARPSQP